MRSRFYAVSPGTIRQLVIACSLLSRLLHGVVYAAVTIANALITAVRMSDPDKTLSVTEEQDTLWEKKEIS